MEEPEKDSEMEEEEFKARTLGATKGKAEQGIIISDTPFISNQEPGINKILLLGVQAQEQTQATPAPCSVTTAPKHPGSAEGAQGCIRRAMYHVRTWGKLMRKV